MMEIQTNMPKAADPKPWFREITVGMKLNPDPAFNKDERQPNKLAVPTEILGIKEAVSQSGIVFQVSTVGGNLQWLDAGWFERP